MSGKLRDYQVLDVLCGGTLYKVRHKVTNNIFTWRAIDCSALSSDRIQNVVNDVRTISKVQSANLLRYYDTILHAPSKTLYFVLEYNCWQSLAQLFEVCTATDKYIAESFAWFLLRELARVCKAVEGVDVVTLRKCITPSSIYVGEGCEVRVDCFELMEESGGEDELMRQAGDVLHALCYRRGAAEEKIKEFHYSDDLHDVVSFLNDARATALRPDVVLYHPTVLANLETLAGPKHISEILLSVHSTPPTSQVNKCDSEKAVELCKAVEPVPRTHLNLMDSPIYSNISPKRKEIEPSNSSRGSMSPTLAALALELPGFVPRCRKPYSEALEAYKPRQISEDTLSQQWMTRLIALRQREESLNKRERDLIAKEIVNSPCAKIIPLHDSLEVPVVSESNGITLPPEITQAKDHGCQIMSRRRHHRRSGSVRTRSRRKSFGYEDLDSSLSADPGDGSMIITAAKITKENMPRRNIFPEISSKKVHFTSANPFVESDDSVTLTFYELENVDSAGYQVPRKEETGLKDITKFKYLDIEKLTSEKRAAMQQWGHSSPSKQAKMTKNIFSDITNTNGIRKTPSKTSLASKMSNSSGQSLVSGKSLCSMDSGGSSGIRTRSCTRQSLAPAPAPPVATEIKKNKRRSLLPFKTPFKFMTSTSTKV